MAIYSKWTFNNTFGEDIRIGVQCKKTADSLLVDL